MKEELSRPSSRAGMMRYRPEIDGLRAVAVSSVVIFHTFPRALQGGFVGVDIFFVISGFLITRLIVSEIKATGRFSFSNFYLRRARRLGPALVFTCALSFVAAAALFSPQDLARFASSLIAAITSTSNIYLWLQSGYFDADSAVKPLLHTWSLSVEEQFYLAWPALLAFAYHLTEKARTKPLGAKLIVAAAFVLSLAANVLFQSGIASPVLTANLKDGAATIFYLMPFRIFELAIGAALHWVIDRDIPERVRASLLVAGTIAVGYAMGAFNSKTIFPTYNGLVPCLGAAMMIVGSAGSSGKLLRSRIMVFIGLISYSLYLVHWPLIVFWSYYRSNPLTSTDRAALIAVSLITAIAMYTYVEKPFRFRKASSGRFVVGLATASIALILVAKPAETGWPSRTHYGPLLSSASSVYGGADCAGATCSHGDVGRPVFVVGDSFSRHLYAGLVSSFPRQHFEFIDEETCTSFSLKWSRLEEEIPNQWRDCRQTRETVNRRIAGQKVIFAFHWVRMAYFDLDARPPPRASMMHLHDYDDLGRFIFTQVSELAKELELRSVLLVSNPPSTGDNIRDLAWCLGRPFAQAQCSDTTARTVYLNLRQYPLVTFSDHRGIPVLDPFDAFCDARECKNVDDDGLYYSDKYHLSRRGSVVLIDHFRDRIARWIADGD
ncbi:acyltransferase family protein [Bradyrhizobium sp. LB12.1]|uniref:acyltransferase family protein n=1 Tax=unclassified Bradyrhizobium TaxID=2631580 RepID=UPI00339AF1F4